MTQRFTESIIRVIRDDYLYPIAIIFPFLASEILRHFLYIEKNYCYASPEASFMGLMVNITFGVSD